MDRKKIIEKWNKVRCVLFIMMLQALWIIPCAIQYEKDYGQEPVEVIEAEPCEVSIVPVQAAELPETQQSDVLKCKWLDVEISQEEYELLCRTTFCEAGTQDFDTQVMVCLTILNRYAAGCGDSIREVVYAKDAYEVTTLDDFETHTWSELTEQAVMAALNENRYPRDMYYFRTKHYHGFGSPYMKSDDLYFSTEGVGK